jgi:hypothetical protein
MKIFLPIVFTALAFLLPALQQEAALNAGNDTAVRGVVFFDRNNNGVFDKPGDKPLKGVAVSNGRDVVVTNRKGLYELPLRDNAAVFVIKPRNWMVPVNGKQMPQFYYMHSSSGISGTKFKGLEPTGSLPGSVDFPLYRTKEADRMDVLVFGDTQPRDNREIYYMSHDLLPALAGKQALFGIILGDVVFDDLNIYDHLTGSMATLGIPLWYVAGNHDNDYTGKNSVEARGVWYRTFGPSYYSFSYGSAHFVVLDNIRWIVEEDKSYYRTGLGKEQMEFLKNEISRLDQDQLLFLLTHIPYTGSTEWADEEEKKAFFELIASHPKSVSLVAHTHRHYHHFIGKEEGYPGENPHHMISVGTACGAWWSGAPDEYGIPHAMMSDGTPTSCSFLHLDKENWKLSWKAARRPADFQMHIHAPDSVSSDESTEIKVVANIFNALPSADVKMRIGNQGEWLSMERKPQKDPVRLAAQEREKRYGKGVTWSSMGGANVSDHIWEARILVTLNPGVYMIEVKAKDEWYEYEGRRLLHVK